MEYSFKEAVKRGPIPPCERFGGCEYYDKCKEEFLACEQFMVYVNATGTRGRVPLREPKRKYYERVFLSDWED